jgi:hypothetical protein
MGVSGNTPIKVYYIWYGNWSGLDGEANTILSSLANGIGGSPYFNINTTYYNSSSQYLINAVSLAGAVNDNYSQGKSLSDFGYGYSWGYAITTTNTIVGTPDQPLYQHWRAGADNGLLTYTFTGVPNGICTVTLGFADAISTAAGQRVFNVAINGAPVLSSFDIFQAVGADLVLSQALAWLFPADKSSLSSQRSVARAFRLSTRSRSNSPLT